MLLQIIGCVALPHTRTTLIPNNIPARFTIAFNFALCASLFFTLYWKFPSFVVVVPSPARQSAGTAVCLRPAEFSLNCHRRPPSSAANSRNTRRTIQVSFQQSLPLPQHPALFTALFCISLCALVSLCPCVMLFLAFPLYSALFWNFPLIHHQNPHRFGKQPKLPEKIAHFRGSFLLCAANTLICSSTPSTRSKIAASSRLYCTNRERFSSPSLRSGEGFREGTLFSSLFLPLPNKKDTVSHVLFLCVLGVSVVQ
jgi:hypothetical protein